MDPPGPVADGCEGGPGGVGSRGGGFPSPGGIMFPLSPSMLQARKKEKRKKDKKGIQPSPKRYKKKTSARLQVVPTLEMLLPGVNIL